jgi:S1-C subfamily serine protease
MVRSLALAALSLPLALCAALPVGAQEKEKAGRHPASLGVAVEPMPAGEAQMEYVVRMVAPGEPAAAAGIRRGDVITGFNGKPFAEGETLPGVIARHKPGDKLNLQVWREGEEKNIAVTLGERPAREPEAPAQPGEPNEAKGPHIGAVVIPADGLTAAMRERLDVTANKGLAVVEVMQDSPAARAGLRRGDVITRAGGKEIADVDNLENAFRKANGKALTLHVVRGGKEKDLSLTPAEGPGGDGPADRPREQERARPSGPSSAAAPRGTAERPREQEKVRPYLGLFAVGTEDLSARLRKRLHLTKEEGVVVTDVAPDSPAHKAGLEHGDVIADVNGKAIHEPEDLRHAIDQAGVGKTVRVTVVRDGEKKELTVKVGEAPVPVITRLPSGPSEREAFPGGFEEEHMERLLEHIDQLERRLERVEKQLRAERSSGRENR